MDDSTHPSLLARLAEGVDPAAWAEFHRRYRDLIRGFAGRYGLQPADCDDVTQEVLLSLSKRLGRFTYEPAKGKFRSYLKTTAVHAILRRRRQERGTRALHDAVEDSLHPDPGGPAQADDPAMAAAWEEEWRQHHVRRAMRRLGRTVSERDRVAFVRYAMQGVPAEETARDLDMSLDQVYQVKSRILKRLTALIAEQVAEEG